MGEIDHLVYAGPDLDAAVDQLEKLLGVRAAPGGRHPRWGTRNALISLGPATYLEVLGPDPERDDREMPRIFGLNRLDEPHLVTWVAKETDLEGRVETAAAAGVHLGEISAASRERPDGRVLSWRLTDPEVVLADGVVPFLIDWGASRHPAIDAPPGCRLSSLRAQHPDPERVAAMLDAIGSDLPVEMGPAPALIAVIQTAMGDVELR
jgi:hypothetical protein